MLTGSSEDDWVILTEVFDAVQSRGGEPGRDDRKFLEARHDFTGHNITRRALPAEFGLWNSVWERFWRLSRCGVFEALFQILAELITTAHLVQIFGSGGSGARLAAGAKAGSKIRRSGARAVVFGRVEDGRGSKAPSPVRAHQTGRADFQHPAFRLASL